MPQRKRRRRRSDSRTEKGGPGEPGGNPFSAGAPLLVALAAIVVYLPAFRGEFIWDDEALISANPLVRADGKSPALALADIWLGGHGVDFFPLTTTLHWLLFQFVGDAPTLYHMVNVLLHATTAVLFWRVLRNLAVPGALFAALIFAVHPVHVPSVAWASELKNTLSAPLLLGSFLALLAGERRPTVGYFLSAVLLFAASLLAKTSGVMFPVFLLLVAWWRWRDSATGAVPAAAKTGGVRLVMLFLGSAALVVAATAGLRLFTAKPLHYLDPGGTSLTSMFAFAVLVWLTSAIIGFAAAFSARRVPSWILPLVPFFQLSALFGAATIWFQHGAIGEMIDMGGAARRLANAAGAVWFYLGKLLMPVNLMAIYPPTQVDRPNLADFLPLAFIIVTAVLLWRFQPKLRGVAFALASFVVLLFPVLGFIKLAYARSGTILADHFLYVPSMAVIAGVAAGLGVLWRNLGARRHATLAIAIVLIVLGLAFRTWGRATLYQNEEGLWQHTLRQNPSAWQGHNRLGQSLFERGDFAKALPHYKKAAELRPNLAPNFNNLGLTYARLNRFPEAIEAYRNALAISPEGANDTTRFRLNLANALGSQAAQLDVRNATADGSRLYEEAIEQYKRAIATDPTNAAAHRNVALILGHVGRREEAIAHARETLRLIPNEPVATELLQELAPR